MTGQTISHFKVLDKLGGGGMGIVYLAEDTRLDRKVALKFLPPHLSTDEEARRRFVQEAKAASALNHANICTIYDIGQTEPAPGGTGGGQTFIAMAHYEGETLKERLERGPLPVAEAVDVARQVAEGLGAAHEKGIIHRDIKPANIFITERGRAVILDFGLAKLTGALDLTKSGSTLGTAFYMSPEQVRGEQVDQRTDVWSLGVVLYEMIEGRKPFAGDYEQAISYAILNSEPPSTHNNAGDAPINALVRDCLKKAADDRIADASQLADRLKGLQGASSSFVAEAGQIGSPATSAAPPRRRWIALIATAIAVAGIAIVATLFLVKPSSKPETKGDEPIRLVVLPFQNLGPAEEEYFSDGITEELSARLGSIDALAVIAQSSANRFKRSGATIADIGRELNVDYIVEGTVRWENRGDNRTVRITPKLIRVGDGTQVWSETYQRQVEGIFEIQEDVGRNVAAALNVRLLQGESDELAGRPTENLEAYQAYLRGIALRRTSGEEPELAAAAFEEAVRLDPQFVEAHYKRVHMYSLAVWLALPQDQERHESLARAALSDVSRLAPGSLQERLAKGYVAYYLDVDYDRARREFEQASEMGPGLLEVIEALGPVYRRLGRYEESVALMERALELDPLNTKDAHEAAFTYMVMKRHQDAERLLDKEIQNDPRAADPYCWKSLNRLLRTGSPEEARRAEAGATGEPGTLPCWWAGLADRKFPDVVRAMDSTNPDELGRAWYGLTFPRDLGRYYFERAVVMHLMGDRTGEEVAWKGLLDVTREDLPPEQRETDRFRATETRAWLALALAHAGLGDRDDAVRELNTLRQKTSHDVFALDGRRYYIALAYVLLGDRDEAIRLLDRDLSGNGLATGPWLEMPFWDPLREEPAFQALVQKYQTG